MRWVTALVAGVALSAQANAQGVSPPTNDSITPDKSVQAPWSDERMRNATPMPAPRIDLPSLRLTPVTPPAPPLAPPSGRFGDPQTLPGGSPPPPSGRSGDPMSYPLRWAGKLFWENNEKGRWEDMVCSGQFIAPRMILTAAHCVRNSVTGEWGRNFQFALQFHQGKYSALYRPACLGTRPDGYAQNSKDEKWRARDYALILTDQPSLTGHFGWQLDWRNTYPAATMIGYPLQLEAGRVVQVAQGNVFFTDELGDRIVVMRQGNERFGPGGSGGAWVGDFRADGGAGNRVISLLAAGNDNVVVGPYFDANFKSLYDWVANGCR